MGENADGRGEVTTSVVGHGSERHFDDLKSTLWSLRKNERHCDVKFICFFNNSREVVCGHKCILMKHSKLLEKLFRSAREEQPGQDVCISLDSIDPKVMKGLLEYLYLGKVKLNEDRTTSLKQLVANLGLDIDMETEKVSRESPESDVESSKSSAPPSPKRKPKIGPKRFKAKGESKNLSSVSTPPPIDLSSSDEESKCYNSNSEKLKVEAKGKRSFVRLEYPDESKDIEVKTLYQKAVSTMKSAKKTHPNLKKEKDEASSGAVPQKRRMNDPDKKVEVKDSKKMRQEDSSSEVDSDEIFKRKSEVSVLSKRQSSSKDPEVSSDSENEDKKSRINDSSRSRARARVFMATKGVCICSKCDIILVSKEALEKHFKEKHQGEESDHASSNSRPSSESEKRNVSKATQPKKKSSKKIKEERRKSNRNTKSDSDVEEESSEVVKPTSAKKKPSKITEKKKVESMSDAPRRRSSVYEGQIGCNLCDETFEKSQNLKNHVVNHFKIQLLALLPSAKPFSCPLCKAVSRDKITLMRHYAFSHKIIFDYCNQEDLLGRRLDDTPSEGKKPLSRTKSERSGKPKKETPKKSREQVATSLLDSSDEENVEKENEKDAREISKPFKSSSSSSSSAVTGTKKSMPPIALTSEIVKFSDNSSDDDLVSSSGIKAAINDFDALFNSTTADDVKEKKDEGENKFVYNKDSDDDGETSSQPDKGVNGNKELI